MIRAVVTTGLSQYVYPISIVGGHFLNFLSSESHKSLRKGDLADHCPFVLPGGSGWNDTDLLLITEPLGCRVESPAFRGALRVLHSFCPRADH